MPGHDKCPARGLASRLYIWGYLVEALEAIAQRLGGTALAASMLELHRARVMGISRIELSGFTESQKGRLKADGFFSEIIAWKLRLFCPTDSSGIKVLDHLLARFPLLALHARKG